MACLQIDMTWLATALLHHLGQVLCLWPRRRRWTQAAINAELQSLRWWRFRLRSVLPPGKQETQVDLQSTKSAVPGNSLSRVTGPSRLLGPSLWDSGSHKALVPQINEAPWLHCTTSQLRGQGGFMLRSTCINNKNQPLQLQL